MTRSVDTRIVRVTREDLPKLEVFVKRDAAQAQPGNSDAPRAFLKGLRSSLERFDFLSSDSHWLLAAEVDGQYVGYLNAVRIHKADGRVGVLYVDELMVLTEFRRRGIASALWQEVHRLATELGVWRVRVMVNPDNQGARDFYRSVGLQERPLVLCEQEPKTPAPDAA
jgi:ribosomal protein S18 acetylase RimI-like enzyme